jgi:XTP/dITP diphosphohydrolase
LTARLQPGDTLVIATHNSGKLREIEAMLAAWRLRLVAAGALGLPEPDETGATFEDNARLKAVAAAEASGMPALGDDSGLSVEALGGRPGIYSARWAGTGGDRDFAHAMRTVEEKLRVVGATTSDKRRARFVAVVCFAGPGREPLTFRGEVAGTLVWPPRGERGFGYDPMFVPDGEQRTFGEIDPRAKDAMSHRARAIAAFAAEVLA